VQVRLSFRDADSHPIEHDKAACRERGEPVANAERVHLFTLERTIRVFHYPAHEALLGEWVSLCTPQFRTALWRATEEAGRLGTKSWLADLTRDPGVPSQADLKWIETDLAPFGVRTGVLALVNIHGASALARMGSRRWAKSANANGMLTYDCVSLDDALELAAQVARGQAA
jgi:hypothetical protein